VTRLKALPARLQAVPQRLGSASGSWRDGRTSSTARGYGYRWQRAREGYLAKHPLCVKCQAIDIVTAATVVDHIVPHRGDERLFWDSDNWQSLCKTHHDSDKAKEEARAGHR
jgi:5-methylcytosine-specific restriction endonuclease McrA